MKKNILSKCLTGIIMLAMLVSTSAFSAAAEEAIETNDQVVAQETEGMHEYAMPDFADKDAILTITCLYTDEDVSKAIDGVRFDVSRVASVKVRNQDVTYTSLDEYAGWQLDFQTMDASTSLEYAKKLAKFQLEEGITGEEKVTDSNGKVEYKGLEYGIYLIRQTGSSGSAVNYTEYDPFLILVPGIGDSNNWIYDVEAYPKPLITHSEDETEVKPTEETEVTETEKGGSSKDETEKETEKGTTKKKKKSYTSVSGKSGSSSSSGGSVSIIKAVKTGDFTNLYLLLSIFGVSLLAIVCVVIAIKLRKRD